MGVEGNKDNPLKISEAAVRATFRQLTGDPDLDMSYMGGALEIAPFGDIFSPEFDVFRLGNLGWCLEVTEAKRSELGISLEKITSLGPDNVKDEDLDHDGGCDYFNGVGLMRAVVASAFVEQAKIEGKQIPDIDSGIVDSVLTEREWLSKARASRVGMTAIVTEDLDAQMREENPFLYEWTMRMTEGLADRLTLRTLLLYKRESEGFREVYTPRIKERWGESLRAMALRTYAWFTPNKPNLVPIPTK